MNERSWFIDGKIRLMTISFSNPAMLLWIARKSSAMPPIASFRMSVYLPNRAGSPSDAPSRPAIPPSSGVLVDGGGTSDMSASP